MTRRVVEPVAAREACESSHSAKQERGVARGGLKDAAATGGGELLDPRTQATEHVFYQPHGGAMGAAFFARFLCDERIFKRVRKCLGADDGQRWARHQDFRGMCECGDAGFRFLVRQASVCVVFADASEDVLNSCEIESALKTGDAFVVKDAAREQPEIGASNPLRSLLIQLMRPAERFPRLVHHPVDQVGDKLTGVLLNAPEAGEIYEVELRVLVEARKRLCTEDGARLKNPPVPSQELLDSAVLRPPPKLWAKLFVLKPYFPAKPAADEDERSAEAGGFSNNLSRITVWRHGSETSRPSVFGAVGKASEIDGDPVAESDIVL